MMLLFMNSSLCVYTKQTTVYHFFNVCIVLDILRSNSLEMYKKFNDTLKFYFIIYLILRQKYFYSNKNNKTYFYNLERYEVEPQMV